MTGKGDKETGFSELFLVLDESGRVAMGGSAPADEQALLARFSAMAGQVQVFVESAEIPQKISGLAKQKYLKDLTKYLSLANPLFIYSLSACTVCFATIAMVGDA